MYLFFLIKIKKKTESFESERLHNIIFFFFVKNDNTVIISGIFNNNIDKETFLLTEKFSANFYSQSDVRYRELPALFRIQELHFDN